MPNSYLLKSVPIALLCTVTSIAACAQLTTVFRFNQFDGQAPTTALIQGTDGNYYGTTSEGGFLNGQEGDGTVFQIVGSGLLDLHVFSGSDGTSPSGLVEGTDGNFYGTTSSGGANDAGTIFKITSTGKFTTLYNFCALTNCGDGASPSAVLIQAFNGNFYGTTVGGGVQGNGTVFTITPSGTLTTLYNFCSQAMCADGAFPRTSLIQSPTGNFLGVTSSGGVSASCSGGCGTIFKITPAGQLTTIYSFCSQPNCADGEVPTGLVQTSNGTFYGTTAEGGTAGFGSVFKINLGGKFTSLYSFCSLPNCSDGGVPLGGLIAGAGEELVGTTSLGGTNGGGTIFETSELGGTFELYTFCSAPGCSDGYDPAGGLLLATNGVIYGTTQFGGYLTCEQGCGTVFNFAGRFAPFVKTLPAAGRVGATIGILGNSLTTATSVTFNGVPAQFHAHSPSLIIAQVPIGAITGTVQVILPSQTLSTVVPFYVLP